MLAALTMIWGSHHVAAILHEVWQRIHRRICTIGSTLKVSRHTFDHSDSTPSLSSHIESLRSSMSQYPLRENETFSRSEGIAWLIIMVWSVPNFRQEIRQSYCRNDNVKYDLGWTPTLIEIYLSLWWICLGKVKTQSNWPLGPSLSLYCLRIQVQLKFC